MKIRADSHVVAMLISGDVTIGKVEIDPKDLLSIPINDEGFSEVRSMCLFVVEFVNYFFCLMRGYISVNLLVYVID